MLLNFVSVCVCRDGVLVKIRNRGFVRAGIVCVVDPTATRQEPPPKDHGALDVQYLDFQHLVRALIIGLFFAGKAPCTGRGGVRVHVEAI